MASIDVESQLEKGLPVSPTFTDSTFNDKEYPEKSTDTEASIDIASQLEKDLPFSPIFTDSTYNNKERPEKSTEIDAIPVENNGFNTLRKFQQPRTLVELLNFAS